MFDVEKAEGRGKWTLVPKKSAPSSPHTKVATSSSNNNEDEVIIKHSDPAWRKFFAFLGPGLLIATVYVDPGQIVVDMESGSQFRYKPLWVLLIANGMGLLFQHMVSRLSIVTGRNLALECRLEYPSAVRIVLWLCVELASIAADVGYVMGTATAIHILTGLGLHWGVLLTGLDTLLALGMQQCGIRKLEMLVGILFCGVVWCYIAELVQTSADVSGIVDGLVPRLWHKNERYGYGPWMEILCANLGAAVCPPNFFLQSALVRTRRVERKEHSLREAIRFNLLETSLCLAVATFINAAMLILAAEQFFPERVVSLTQGADLLRNTLGDSAQMAFAIAMLCAGQSSSLTGVLSTQYVMEGFFELAIPAWVLRLATRVIAIAPAFYVVFAYGPDTAADVIEQAQVVVNFVVPFTVLPLTKFLTSETKMGRFKLSRTVAGLCWGSSALAVLLNLVSMVHNVEELDQDMTPGMRILIQVACVAVYVCLTLYLCFKKCTVASEGVDKMKMEADEAAPSGGALSLRPEHWRRGAWCMSVMFVVLVLGGGGAYWLSEVVPVAEV